MGYLFPGLPDEIGFECLARVELNSHHNLRCVCKSWNAVLKSPQFFYQERKRLKISEQRICLVYDIDSIQNRVAIYDPAKNSFKSLPPVPARIYGFCQCHFVKQKLVLITDTLNRKAHVAYCSPVQNCVWLYDFFCSKWRQGAQMPIWRSAFASAADEDGGPIYIGGGYNIFRKPVRSALVYNVEEDKWDLLPDMNTYMEDIRGAFADGKFYVMNKPSSLFFEVFDSYTRSWKTMQNRFNSVFFVSAFGRFYCFSPRGLIEYDYNRDKLHIVGPLPTMHWDQIESQYLNFGLVAGHKIFLIISDPSQGQAFYMLAPPSETGGAFKWTGIERPSGLHDSVILGATQVDL